MELLLAVLAGLPLTLLVTAAAFAIGLLLGVPIMLGLRSRIAPLRLATRLLVDLIRGVPTIVWLFLLYFGVSLGTLRFDSLSAAIVGLGIISAAYLAEIYRGAFQTLPRGQGEAAQALGLGRGTTFVRVLAPQAIRTALPSLTSYLLALVKDSSIASTIGVAEVVFAATTVARQNPDTAGLTPFFLAAAVYLAVSIPLAILARRLDTRLRRSY
ncbi:amino acid ABC transporter permease [Rathayibacter sp. VKM Ac-2929]|uniref:amino acid ABC transporter permease n=1 Tax=Rathayibacter sp. VKM Ac-2929 TaxID=2929480 RepID=UPI001FB53307|nr:amino acid ABC transporter permease [Rathayibacter sp. VKM Ac-2929]MCJ1675466.1 amino acid ABC transporter permease [Rathayibacter sp. VKM Ac-2929]